MIKAYLITNLIIWILASIGSVGTPGMFMTLLLSIGMAVWTGYTLHKYENEKKPPF